MEKIKVLAKDDIRTILRAADEIIGEGGRTLLAKILKGSREKKVLALGLDKCPSYGQFKSKKMEEVLEMIDWMIDHDFLDIEFRGKLPMLIFTERGWEIERDIRVDELLEEWDRWLEQGIETPDMTYLKDRNRGMILLLLQKARESGRTAYIPFLKAWEKIDYKKVKAEIRDTINALELGAPIDEQEIKARQSELDKALEGYTPQDFYLKCWECGKRFLFTVGEQKFYKQKGFQDPKRCEACRTKGKLLNSSIW